MTIGAALPPSGALSDRAEPSAGTPRRFAAARWLGWGLGSGTIALVWGLTRTGPAWLAMSAIAATSFFALKLATLRGSWKAAAPWRIAGYLFAWPGMNAQRFLAGEGCRRDTSTSRGVSARMPSGCPRYGELAFALAKLVGGLVCASWAMVHATEASPFVVGWVGMLGIIFTLHFGVFHAISWLWRAAGVDAPPIMRAPIAATSLAEFWGERWNVAFAESARRFIVRPLARRVGARRAGLAVFVVSGLVHETVISLPARGGWGGPTLYFLLQALGVALEKSAWGVRVGLGRGVRGWLWTFLFTATPLPLLFHEPFVGNLIVPLYRSLAAFLS